MRFERLMVFAVNFEIQYAMTIPSVIRKLPTELTIAALLETNPSTAITPPIAAQVKVSQQPTALIQPTALTQPAATNITPTVCVYCGNGCGPNQCFGQLYDSIYNSVK